MDIKSSDFKSKCNYWIYTMSKSMINEYTSYNEMYISSFAKANLKIGDIIYLYSKKNAKTGFVGILRVSSKMKDNDDKIQIFQDVNYNSYIAAVDNYIFFDKYINLSEVMDSIQMDVVGYKSTTSFRIKNLIHNNCLEGLVYNGKELGKRLMEFVEEESSCESDEYLETTGHEQESGINKVVDKYLETIDDEQQSESEQHQSGIYKAMNEDSDQYSDKSIISDEDYSSENTESEEEDDGQDGGIIPILVIPCEDFKLPKKKKDKYFKEHYKSCNKCDMVNNNNVELTGMFNLSIQFKDITDKDDVDLDDTLNAYFGLLNYILLVDDEDAINDELYIRIFNIMNGHKIYNNCLLVCLAQT